MSKQLKLRRGTTAQHSTFTGASGEVTVDTTKKALVVHDGTTAGGVPLATEASVSSLSAKTFAFKNRLINAQGLVNQRVVSGTVTLAAGVYGHDRFKAGASGCTYTFSTSANVTTFTITAGSLIQVIEGLNLESGTYCLGWTGTSQGKIGAGTYSSSGVTGTITGGTNTNVEFNTGTLSLPQLEKGSTATSFDYRPYGTELALCQRYAQRWGGGYTYDSVATGFWTGATIGTIQVPLKATMRTQPSLTTSGSWCLVIAAGGVQAVSTFSLDTNASNINTAYINYTTAAGGTTGQGTALLAQGSTSSSFVLSAEL